MGKKHAATSIKGVGFIFKIKTRNRSGERIESRNWSIRLSDGTQHSTGMERQGDAFAELIKLSGKNVAGTVTNIKGTIGQLLDLNFKTAKKDGNKTLADKERKLKILRSAFGNIRIKDFRVEMAEAWLKRPQMKRNGQKSERGTTLTPASQNRYMEELRRSFNLGIGEELCAKCPALPFAKENNVRKGILLDADYERFRDSFDVTAQHARLFLVLAYHTGMRAGELFLLRWDQVDFVERVIRLDPDQTKNSKPRIVPIYGDMQSFLVAAFAAKSEQCNRVIQFEGKPVRSVIRSWRTACRVTGLTGLLRHDMRRTALTNMRRAGLGEVEAMQISGHLTLDTFIRYQISTEEATKESGVKMDAYLTAKRKKAPKSKAPVQ